MMKSKNILIIFCFCCCFIAKSQQILTLEDAIKIALENNYDIKIVKNDVKSSEINQTAGNAGMLPKVVASIVDSNGIQNSSITRVDGTSTSLDNAKNTSLNAGISLNWTVFDGFKMFAKWNQLKELKKLSENGLKIAILTKISDVNNIYFNLVQQKQSIVAIDSSIVISTQRLEYAKNRFMIGKASKLEVLNAEVDLNTDLVSSLNQKQLYENTKIMLNQVLGRGLDEDYSVIDDITVDNSLDLKELTELAKKQNPDLMTQIINKRVSELDLKQTQSGLYPIIGVNAGYNLAETTSSLGYSTASSSNGITFGFSATWNIFDGLTVNRNKNIIKTKLETANIQIEKQESILVSQLITAYKTYTTNIELIGLEEKNTAIAKQNLDITLDKFRIGSITANDFRVAQLNYITAIVRYTNTQFQAKLSEISLRELAGNLLL